MDPYSDKHVTFPGGKSSQTPVPEVEKSNVDVKSKSSKRRQSKKQDKHEIVLDDIASDASDAPRKNKMGEVCRTQNEEAGIGGLAYTTEDYLKQKDQESNEFETNALSALESLAPFVRERLNKLVLHVPEYLIISMLSYRNLNGSMGEYLALEQSI